jgi:uncharacterized radical SAM superfamily Fe-S cluster-containing enzyme
MNKTDLFLEKTESICPVCLKPLGADIFRRGEEIFIDRFCPEHGQFSEVIWRGKPDFESWKRTKEKVWLEKNQRPINKGCPLDCGICPDHGQLPCTVLFEITQRCNLGCPVCFAGSGFVEAKDSGPLDLLLKQLDYIRQMSGKVVLQFSGGEPTLHPNLLELVNKAASLFPAVQLNTNGIKLASDPDLATNLVKAGLSWVFLQFDGITDNVFKVLRGRPLLEIKKVAIEACAAAGLPVVLVPTVVAGVNDYQLGDLLRLAISFPIVRGLHLQPMTKSGRNSLLKTPVITLPETLTLLGEQSRGLVDVTLAFPPGCEHERCSFHLRFRRLENGTLIPSPGKGGCCVDREEGSTTGEKGNAKNRAIDIILNSWQGPQIKHGLSIPMAKIEKKDAFDEFIEKARSETFSVTAMAFQDVFTLDLNRLKSCCVFIFEPPKFFVPFCAKNLTSVDGFRLYRP